MPSNWSMVDNNFPTFAGDEPVRLQIGKLVNYMMVLTDQLKYNLANLDATNWNKKAMTEFQQNTTQNVEQDVEDLDVTVGEASESLLLIKQAVEDMAETLLELQKTVDDWEKKEFPTLKKTLKELNTEVQKLKQVIALDGSGGISIGADGNVLNLVGTVYINGVLVE